MSQCDISDITKKKENFQQRERRREKVLKRLKIKNTDIVIKSKRDFIIQRIFIIFTIYKI